MDTEADHTHIDDGEAAEARDPSVGEGTVETAPHHIPLPEDEELDPGDEDGTALDDDDETDDDSGEILDQDEPEGVE